MSDLIESNSYAVAYRLLGSRPAAQAAAGIASERVRQRFDSTGGLDATVVAPEIWLPMLIDFTVEASVDPDNYGEVNAPVDEFSGLREALRRRLVRASRLERVVGALVHLSGYRTSEVSDMLAMDEERVRTAARVLAPPPGIDYRELGDPELIGPLRRRVTRHVPIPYPSTIAVAVLLVILVLLATQCRGARPTLVEEGLRAQEVSVLSVERVGMSRGSHGPSPWIVRSDGTPETVARGDDEY